MMKPITSWTTRLELGYLLNGAPVIVQWATIEPGHSVNNLPAPIAAARAEIPRASMRLVAYSEGALSPAAGRPRAAISLGIGTGGPTVLRCVFATEQAQRTAQFVVGDDTFRGHVCLDFWYYHRFVVHRGSEMMESELGLAQPVTLLDSEIDSAVAAASAVLATDHVVAVATSTPPHPASRLAAPWSALPVSGAPTSTPPSVSGVPASTPPAVGHAPVSTPPAVGHAPVSTPPAAAAPAASSWGRYTRDRSVDTSAVAAA